MNKSKIQLMQQLRTNLNTLQEQSSKKTDDELFARIALVDKCIEQVIELILQEIEPQEQHH